MLPAKRHVRIIELLRDAKIASLKEMAETLDISLSTIRRDVDHLCSTGELSRTHGGAVLNLGPGRGVEPEAEVASGLERAAKQAIAVRAAELIRPGQTVVFDSGTTTAATARAAQRRGIGFTAVTNDVLIAAGLSESGNVETQVTGGRIRPGSSTLLGGAAFRFVGELRADLAFIGAHSVAADGLSDTSIELAEIKRAIIAAADVVVLVADSTKFLRRSFCRFGGLRDVHLIMTDSRLDPDALEELTRQKVAVELVEVS